LAIVIEHEIGSSAEESSLDFKPLLEKDWAVASAAHTGGDGCQRHEFRSEKREGVGADSKK
jgi:hypothetical protein